MEVCRNWLFYILRLRTRRFLVPSFAKSSLERPRFWKFRPEKQTRRKIQNLHKKFSSNFSKNLQKSEHTAAKAKAFRLWRCSADHWGISEMEVLLYIMYLTYYAQNARRYSWYANKCRRKTCVDIFDQTQKTNEMIKKCQKRNKINALTNTVKAAKEWYDNKCEKRKKINMRPNKVIVRTKIHSASCHCYSSLKISQKTSQYENGPHFQHDARDPEQTQCNSPAVTPLGSCD